MRTVRDEIREKSPGMVERAANSRATAILLFCRECCGGSVAEAGRCQTRECFLWPFGYAARKERGETDEGEAEVTP